jgi:hypothetical protein
MKNQKAVATCQIKNWEEAIFSEALRGPKLTKGSFVLAYQGDLQGEGILEELKVHFSDKRAAMYGLLRITGRLGELSGSFVLKHTGRFVNGIVSSKQTVVPGSATGRLKGLRGEMSLQSASAKEFPILFRYYFA